jgi:hypothetical protein
VLVGSRLAAAISSGGGGGGAAGKERGKGVAARISLLAKGVRVGRGGGHGPQSAR